MESSIIILNSFNGNFSFSNPARNNNPVHILVMQYKKLQCTGSDDASSSEETLFRNEEEEIDSLILQKHKLSSF